jgi:hypothetical protein
VAIWLQRVLAYGIEEPYRQLTLASAAGGHKTAPRVLVTVALRLHLLALRLQPAAL